MDRLSQLLQWFPLHAGAFYAGQISTIQEFEKNTLQGHFHLIRRGPVTLLADEEAPCFINVPTIIFMPRPNRHQLIVDKHLGADVVCANIRFGSEGRNPITDSLPNLICVPMEKLPGSQALMALIESDAFADQSGRRALLDRFCEIVLIHALGHCMINQQVSLGTLAGLRDVRLRKVLHAVHENPAHKWDLPEMANLANMSRARFAEHFREVIGQTPADYLVSWRISLAQKLLRAGRPLKAVVDEVGYGGTNAFTKAFGRKTGMPPAQWLRERLPQERG